MQYYKPLPEFINNFIIKPKDPSDLVKGITGHSWTCYNTEQFLTKQGQDWFKQHQIILTPTSQYFICDSNTTGSVHTDQPFTWGLNFIFEGHGEMQWVDIDADYIFNKHTVPSGETVIYKKYTTIRNISIIKSWSGISALVRINVPHRIVTNNSHRICISLRPTFPNSKYKGQTFEEMCQIIDNQ
jgi:hypothetical protein